ncbi:MAG: SPOR domain-containing protein [Pseudomonadota bacterium]
MIESTSNHPAAATDPPPGLADRGVGLIKLAANWAIAAVSLAVIGGFVYWTVNLGTRDPHAVPIIRAMEGPARIAPDDPGGQRASHQGLAVNQVQSDGGVAAPAEQVVLAPSPGDPADEDQPLARAQKPTQDAPAQTTSSDGPADDSAQTTETATAEPSEEELDALEIVDSVVEREVAQELAETNPAMVPAAVIRGTSLSPRTSPRPKARPGGLQAELRDIEPTAAVVAPAVTGASTVSAVETVPPGTHLVQLGAYDRRELAANDWLGLLEKHPDLLGDKKRLILEAQSGGRRFYRLRAVGFGNIEESRTLCSALLARATPCISVTTR